MFEDREREHHKMELIKVKRHKEMKEHDEGVHHDPPPQTTRHTKKTAHVGDPGTTCVHCQGRFRATKMHVGGKLCANCFKIHESIKRTVEMHEGTFKMKVVGAGKVHMKLKCAEGHEWTIGMQSRKAKNWCKVCKEH